MRRKGFFEKFKYPRGAALILLYSFTLVCCAGSVLAAVFQPSEDSVFSLLVYLLYALAALSLGYSVYTLVIYIPKWKRKIEKRVKSHKFAADVLEKYGLRTRVFSYLSFFVSVAFTCMNAVSAVRYKSVWYCCFFIYYLSLTLFRCATVLIDSHCKKVCGDDVDEYERRGWRLNFASGVFLLVLDLAACATVTQMILSGSPAQRGEIMVIANAAYTFYKMTMAIFNMFKAGKFGDPVVRSLRNLNFADACISVVSLTVLMIATFGENGEMIYLKAISGFFACVAILITAVLTLNFSVKRLKLLKGDTKDGR